MEAGIPKVCFMRKIFRFPEWLNGSGLNNVNVMCAMVYVQLLLLNCVSQETWMRNRFKLDTCHSISFGDFGVNWGSAVISDAVHIKKSCLDHTKLEIWSPLSKQYQTAIFVYVQCLKSEVRLVFHFQIVLWYKIKQSFFLENNLGRASFL